MALAPAQVTALDEALAPEWHPVPQQVEAAFVRGESDHDEVGVEAVQQVRRAGIIPRLRPLCADDRCYLMLALTRDRRVRKHYGQTPKGAARGHARCNMLAEGRAELCHEFGARRDRVVVERLRRRRHTPCNRRGRLRGELGAALARRKEAACTLLVHLGARRDAVKGDDQKAAWLRRQHEPVEGTEDGAEGRRAVGRHWPVGRVRGMVDDLIKVNILQIQEGASESEGVGGTLSDA